VNIVPSVANLHTGMAAYNWLISSSYLGGVSKAYQGGNVGKLMLNLLGTPEIYLDGRLLRFPTRKAEALLIYLAVEGGLHSRASLITLLWPESSPELGRAAFRNTLARLRQVLGNPALLNVEADLLGLAEPADSDVRRVESLLHHVKLGNLLDIETLATEVDLRGGNFLTGFTLDDSLDFDDWSTLKREYYFRVIDQVFNYLTQPQMNYQSIFVTTVQTLLKWLEHNPSSESAYLRLMEYYLSVGDRTAALNTYQACCSTLKLQLDIEPSEAIQSLAASIQSEFEFIHQTEVNTPQLIALEKMRSLIADDALFINPTGHYRGKQAISRCLAQNMSQGLYFDLWDFQSKGMGVVYKYRVMQGSSILDANNDGLTIVENGKIVFDGTARTAPSIYLDSMNVDSTETKSLEIVKLYYAILNGDYGEAEKHHFSTIQRE
jgi:DNA-binding SARP family transcriptional activator